MTYVQLQRIHLKNMCSPIWGTLLTFIILLGLFKEACNLNGLIKIYLCLIIQLTKLFTEPIKQNLRKKPFPWFKFFEFIHWKTHSLLHLITWQTSSELDGMHSVLFMHKPALVKRRSQTMSQNKNHNIWVFSFGIQHGQQNCLQLVGKWRLPSSGMCRLLHSLVQVNHHFRETPCRHLQGQKVSQASNYLVSFLLLPSLFLTLCSLVEAHWCFGGLYCHLHGWRVYRECKSKLLASCLLSLFFYLEHGGNSFLQITSKLPPAYTAAHPRNIATRTSDLI